MDNFDLDQVVLQLGRASNPYWTVRNAVEGVQIFGGIGSGKTSGSGKTLANRFLKTGFGGLVLTVKPDEKDEWVKYCTEAGRIDDLIIVEPGGKYHFNFLEYEASQAANKNATTENLVQVLKTVIRAGETKDSGRSDDAFWESALDMLMFNVIDLCSLAYGELSVTKLYDIAQTTLKENDRLVPSDKPEQFKTFQKAMTLAHRNVHQQITTWYKSLSALKQEFYKKNRDLYDRDTLIAVPDLRTYQFFDQFFMEVFKTLSDKTRSIIDFSFSGFLYRLLREPVYSLFCRESSNFSPDDSLEGKIILLNLPVKLYHKIGRDSQIMFKYIWQRRMEKRHIELNGRPVFLWADEAQNFLHEHDADFQATARSSCVATVYISQNLPNYYASMGGDKATYKVKSFLGTLNTKIFHANADIETNEYASSLIGEDYVLDKTETTGISSEEPNLSTSERYQLERLVRPEEFIKLSTGGPKSDGVIQCIVHRQGNPIEDGHNFKRMTFRQDLKKP